MTKAEMKETRLLMENQAEPSVAGMTKEKAWNYAIGIVQVDGIKPSDDFLELVEKKKRAFDQRGHTAGAAEKIYHDRGPWQCVTPNLVRGLSRT
uniref:Uncharacterized protein n=1 Tax=uncultured bacterium contig00001 TaxID=1181493 RepID=A0A806KQU7_9BACT|nr:hypothetical protein [uncultured bacterium contig00001]